MCVCVCLGSLMIQVGEQSGNQQEVDRGHGKFLGGPCSEYGFWVLPTLVTSITPLSPQRER